MKATRPNFSDVERESSHYTHECNTCGVTVYQPTIKGLWYHDNGNWGDSNRYGCKKLVPVKQRSGRDMRWKCEHDFRFSEDMEYSLKCTKCGYPLLFGLIDIEVLAGTKYFCYTCNKEFKNMMVHCKRPHGNQFEFKEIARN